VSSSNFFVLPSPYTAGDVIVADRMTIGQTKTVSLSTAGKIGLVFFDAAANQKVSLLIRDVTLQSSTLTIYDPSGNQLSRTSFNLAGRLLDVLTLPVSGTYTMLISPASGQTGSLTLTLYDVMTVTDGPITPGGAPVIVSIPTPGQTAHLTFSGTTGQRISVLGSSWRA